MPFKSIHKIPNCQRYCVSIALQQRGQVTQAGGIISNFSGESEYIYQGDVPAGSASLPCNPGAGEEVTLASR